MSWVMRALLQLTNIFFLKRGRPVVPVRSRRWWTTKLNYAYSVACAIAHRHGVGVV